jgi:hypothetical protein
MTQLILVTRSCQRVGGDQGDPCRPRATRSLKKAFHPVPDSLVEVATPRISR